jgi:carbon-monoxide dehydrogenase large subunit
MLVNGQLHGGIVQSTIGQAMFEEVVYDEQGQLITGTLMDYAVPRASHVPHLNLIAPKHQHPSIHSASKVLAKQERLARHRQSSGAIVDALAPFGVKHLDMPVKPEALWRIINSNQ